MHSILDKSIDDIEDLPGFEVPEPGIYSLTMNTELKKINNKDCVEAKFVTIELIEANDPAAPITKVGTSFGVLFMLDNDIALGRMKELLAPISQHFGVTNLGTLVTETCKDLVVVAKIKRRADKVDKEKFYAEISNLSIG